MRKPSLSVAAPPLPPPQARPASRTDLFWSFTWLALQGFGGVLAVVQRELVDKKKWLTREEFIEDWAVAQVMPGPNVINLGLMMGDRYFGLTGALAAMAGLLTFPLLIVLMLAGLFASVADAAAAQGALRGMGAVAAGLITATGLKLIPALKKNVMGVAVNMTLAILTFAGIALLRIPLAWVLLAVGTAACCWAYARLGLHSGSSQSSKSP
jgi:chromate transporter